MVTSGETSNKAPYFPSKALFCEINVCSGGGTKVKCHTPFLKGQLEITFKIS